MATASSIVRAWKGWLKPCAFLVAASVALLSDGALFSELSQLTAVLILLSAGLVLTILDWDRVHALACTRLGFLTAFNGLVLVTSALLSLYRWASIRELLKAAALVEAFLLSAAAIDRESVRDRLLLLFYWWSVAAAGAGSLLYLVGMRWPDSWLGSYAVRTLATAANRLSAFFGYANALAAFLLVSIAIGVALAWQRGRRGTAALIGLVVPLAAMQMAASRWGYVVLGFVLVVMIVLGLRAASGSEFTKARVVIVTGLVLAVAAVSTLIPLPAASPVSDVGQRFGGIGAEIRNSGAEMSSIGGRIAMIRDALHYGAAYPVLGSGPGTYASVYFRFRSTNFFSADPHSQAMLWLTESGVVGLASQSVLLLALLWLIWIAALRDIRRDSLLMGAAVGVTGVVVHAMLDWDFQSYFLPLMVAGLCGASVSALTRRDTWLLKSRRSASVIEAASRRDPVSWRGWRRLAVGATSVCIVVTLFSVWGSLVAGSGASAYSADPARAARLFAVAQRINPFNAEYPYRYAKANLALANQASTASSDQAVRNGFERAVLLNPWFVGYQIDQARYLLSRGDTECIAIFENLTQIDPGDPGTFTSLAWAYHGLYRNDARAMKALDQAFGIEKNYYEAWLVLGRIQEDKGQTADAIVSYWKAAGANRKDVQALGRLGNLYDSDGNAAGAARAAFELVQRTPDSPDAQRAFTAVGVRVVVDGARIDGRQVAVTWTETGTRVAESFALAVVRPGSDDIPLVQGIGIGQNSATALIPQAVPDGPFRLRLYAMAPDALKGVDNPWVAWAESDELVLATD